ncbi:hypothetical protein ACQ4PT_065229 [Festuca glaucescens]
MSSRDSIHNHAMAVGAIVATAVRLSGDILASILLRLPASDLHRFRRVCKEWRDVGTCNGLLCFLDVGQSAINVVDPFTGESFALPLPPLTARRCELDAYSFGFNTNTRRCKIILQGEGLYIAGKKVLLHVYMIGGGEKWRSLKVTGVEPRNSYGRPVCASGAVYWSQQISLIDSDAWAFLTADTWLGVLKALFVREGDCLVYKYTLKLPHWRRPMESQALQRGHLLMQDFVDGELAGHDLGSGKLLLKKVNKKDEEEGDELAKNTDMTTGCNTRRLFVPILFNQEPSAIVTRVPQKKGRVRTFGYVPPVSPAPLAHCFNNLRGLHTI